MRTIDRALRNSGRVALLAVAATAALSVWAGDAVAASLGQITEFSTLQGSAGYLTRIAAGPDGNLWFTDQGCPDGGGDASRRRRQAHSH